MMNPKRKMLINQPAGLGDIIWVQPIIEKYVRMGFHILFPVISLYYNWVKKYLPRRNVEYLVAEESHSFKDFMKQQRPHLSSNFVYLPLSNSDRLFPNAPVMASKYFLTNTPMGDYRNTVPKVRDIGREEELARLLNVSETDDFVLVTERWGTPPSENWRSIRVSSHSNKSRIITIDYTQPHLAQFSPFDWIGLIERAREVHFVATSFAFLADMYCTSTCEMHLYDRVRANEMPKYLKLYEYVHRHPNWIYHI
jgi:hypothetical protein